MSDGGSGKGAGQRPRGAVRWVLRGFLAGHAFLIRRGIVHRMRGMPLIVLTTTGRKSGRPQAVPLGSITEGDGWVVIASNAGSARHPQWWLNLVANPGATIEVDGRRVEVRMQEIRDPAEYKRIWSRVVATMPGYDAYTKKTSRSIPLGWLRPATTSASAK